MIQSSSFEREQGLCRFIRDTDKRYICSQFRQSSYMTLFPLLFYSIKWENSNISHVDCPDIIFLNGASFWSQNAYRGPWPGGERYTDRKQPPAGRARLSNCHTLYNTVQCSVLPRLLWAVATAPKCTTHVGTVKIHHPFKTIERSILLKQTVLKGRN